MVQKLGIFEAKRTYILYFLPSLPY